MLTLKDQRELEKLRAQNQREIKRLKQELWCKEKALAEAADLLIYEKDPGLVGRGRGRLTPLDDRRKALGILDEGIAAGARATELARLLGVGLSSLQRRGRVFAGNGDRIIAVKAASAWFLTDSRTRSARGSCSPASSRSSHRSQP